MKDKKTAAWRGKPGGNGSGDPLGSNTEIGRKLRQYYDELMSDEVPDRFTRLLSQLEEREKQGQSGSTADED